MNSISNFLKDQRLLRGYSLRDLTKILNEQYQLQISKSTLQRLEQGQTSLSAKLLFALADLYDLNLASLEKMILLNNSTKRD